MLRVALAGFGYAGKTFHAPLLHVCAGVELAAILQRTGNSAAEHYPDAHIVRSMDELLRDDSLSLVVIATANPSHFPLAMQAIEAGRHVVLDKPMTTTWEQAHQLAQAAQQRGVLLTVFHNRRWDGDFLTLQQLVQQGTLGGTLRLFSSFDRYRPTVDSSAWRQRNEPGSGVWFDLGPHLVDQAVVLFGEPSAITASIRRERPGAKADDAFDVTLEFRSGARATVAASVLACAPRARFAVDGDRGSWVKFGLDPQEAALKAGKIPQGEDWGREPAALFGTLTKPDGGEAFSSSPVATIAGNYPAFYAGVRDAITHGAPLPVTTHEAVDILRLLEAGVRSSDERRTVPL